MYKNLTAAAAAVLLAASAAFAAGLPEIEGWTNGTLRETKLETVSSSHGTWQEREYRTARGAKFLAVLMEGAGPKLWKPVSRINEGGAPDGSSAEQLTVAGLDAVLESRPVLGLSLVVKTGKDAVLTLESQSAGKEELTEAAEKLIETMKASGTETQG